MYNSYKACISQKLLYLEKENNELSRGKIVTMAILWNMTSTFVKPDYFLTL